MTVADQVRSEERLSSKLSDYAGQWVAVIDFEVVESAGTWDGLLERLNTEQRERAELFHVSEHPDAINLY
jgi:hypothetical protein